MINLEEIREGNFLFLQLQHPSNIVKVVSVHEGGARVEGRGAPGGMFKVESSLYPITITDYWLNKFGFTLAEYQDVPNVEKWIKLNNKGLKTLWGLHEGMFYHFFQGEEFNVMSEGVEFVHGLQNKIFDLYAIRLTASIENL